MSNSIPEPESIDDSNDDSIDESIEGGRSRRQKGGKTRKVNSALKSWVAFVKKISKEENISYPKAMKRASTRKSEWKRGGHGEFQIEKSLTRSRAQSKSKSQAGGEPLTPSEIASKTGSANIVGGSRRKRRGSRKSRSSRRR